jgi:chromosomal replication initiator protein
MYLLREETLSFPQIGEALGGRDHSTVMSAIKKITDQIKHDDRLQRDIATLKQQVHAQVAVV